MSERAYVCTPIRTEWGLKGDHIQPFWWFPEPSICNGAGLSTRVPEIRVG